MSKQKILVVDDMQANRMLLSLELESRFEIEQAGDGQDAVDKAHTTSPDLILLDIQMPEMCGFEVLAELKADDSTKQIPVIFMSAHVEPEEQEKAEEMGADGFVMKPIDTQLVLEEIKRILPH